MANLIVGVLLEHGVAVEERHRGDDIANQLSAQMTRRKAEAKQLSGRLVNHFNAQVIVNGDNAFVDRLHHGLLLAHQQPYLLFNTAGEEPREDEQRQQQQDGGNQDIHHLVDGYAVEVAGEIADGDNPYHLTLIIKNRRFAAQRNAQPALANSGGAFTP